MLIIGGNTFGQPFVALPCGLRGAETETERDLLPGHATTPRHLEEPGFQLVHLPTSRGNEAQSSGDIGMVHLRLAIIGQRGSTEQERHEPDGLVRSDGGGMNLSATLPVGGRMPLGDPEQGGVYAACSYLIRMRGREGVGGLIR